MKLIIDTDPGVDDAMAIFYAVRDPAIELIGLTTVFGNVTVDIATRNALCLLDRVGLDVPVAAGAAQALVLPPSPPSSHVHGTEGFGDIPAQTPSRPPSDQTAAEFLVAMAQQHKGALVVCAIGPITNIAHAIRLDPMFAQNVKRIVFMGGAARVPGNITPHAEANTYHDPHALAEVIASGAETVMVGLDVTLATLFTAGDFERLAQISPDLGGFLRDASHFYLDFYRSVGREGCGLHDPMAVIAAAHPEMFKMDPLRLSVIPDGEQQGRTLPQDTDTDTGTSTGTPPIAVCTGGDMEAVKRRFVTAFAETGSRA